jgi:hypothetical protein
MIYGFCASSQASTTCAGVAPLHSATLLTNSTRTMLALRTPGEKRGTMLRKSVGSNFVFSSILPVRNPCAERSKWHETDTRLLQRRKKPGLWTTPEKRVFALHRGDRLDGVRPANRLNPGLRHAEVFNLTLAIGP